MIFIPCSCFLCGRAVVRSDVNLLSVVRSIVLPIPLFLNKSTQCTDITRPNTYNDDSRIIGLS
jgi:hypothetical protein